MKMKIFGQIVYCSFFSLAFLLLTGCARDKQTNISINFNLSVEQGNQKQSKSFVALQDLPQAKAANLGSYPDIWAFDEFNATLKRAKFLFQQFSHAQYLKNYPNEFFFVIQVLRAEERTRLQLVDNIFAQNKTIQTLDQLDLLNKQYDFAGVQVAEGVIDQISINDIAENSGGALLPVIKSLQNLKTKKLLSADQTLTLNLLRETPLFFRVYVYHPLDMYFQFAQVFTQEKANLAQATIVFKPLYTANSNNFAIKQDGTLQVNLSLNATGEYHPTNLVAEQPEKLMTAAIVQLFEQSENKHYYKTNIRLGWKHKFLPQYFHSFMVPMFDTTDYTDYKVKWPPKRSVGNENLSGLSYAFLKFDSSGDFVDRTVEQYSCILFRMIGEPNDVKPTMYSRQSQKEEGCNKEARISAMDISAAFNVFGDLHSRLDESQKTNQELLKSFFRPLFDYENVIKSDDQFNDLLNTKFSKDGTEETTLNEYLNLVVGNPPKNDYSGFQLEQNTFEATPVYDSKFLSAAEQTYN